MLGAASNGERPVPGCKKQTGIDLLQCKIGKDMHQHHRKQAKKPAVLEMDRYYLHGKTGCKDYANLKPGSKFAHDANEIGRVVNLVSVDCNTYTTLVHSSNKSWEVKDIRKVVNELDKVKTPSVLSLGHEMSREVCIDGKDNMGTPTDYRKADRKFADIVRSQEKYNLAEGLMKHRKIELGWDPEEETFNKTVQNKGRNEVFTSCKNLHKKGVSASDVLHNANNYWPSKDDVDVIETDSYAFNKLDIQAMLANDPCPKQYVPKEAYGCNAKRVRSLKIVGAEIGAALAKKKPTERQITGWLKESEREMDSSSKNGKHKQYADLGRISGLSYWDSHYNLLNGAVKQFSQWVYKDGRVKQHS